MSAVDWITDPHAGNPEITAWCPTCECRSVPLGIGWCGFCETPIAGEALRVVQARMEREKARREGAAELLHAAREKARNAPPPPLPGKQYRRKSQTCADYIGVLLSKYGPLTRSDIQARLSSKERRVHYALTTLKRAGFIEVVEMRSTGGCPAPVYGLCTDTKWWLA